MESRDDFVAVVFQGLSRILQIGQQVLHHLVFGSRSVVSFSVAACGNQGLEHGLFRLPQGVRADESSSQADLAAQRLQNRVDVFPVAQGVHTVAGVEFFAGNGLVDAGRKIVLHERLDQVLAAAVLKGEPQDMPGGFLGCCPRADALCFCAAKNAENFFHDFRTVAVPEQKSRA